MGENSVYSGGTNRGNGTRETELFTLLTTTRTLPTFSQCGGYVICPMGEEDRAGKSLAAALPC